MSTRFGQEFEDFEAEAWSVFCYWCLVEAMRFYLGQDSEARFGQDFEVKFSWNVDVCLRFWRDFDKQNSTLGSVAPLAMLVPRRGILWTLWTLSVTAKELCLCLDLREIRLESCRLVTTMVELQEFAWIKSEDDNGNLIMIAIMRVMMKITIRGRDFYASQCQSHFPFSSGHPTFVSDLLTCQKQKIWEQNLE